MLQSSTAGLENGVGNGTVDGGRVRNVSGVEELINVRPHGVDGDTLVIPVLRVVRHELGLSVSPRPARVAPTSWAHDLQACGQQGEVWVTLVHLSHAVGIIIRQILGVKT